MVKMLSKTFLIPFLLVSMSRVASASDLWSLDLFFQNMKQVADRGTEVANKKMNLATCPQELGSYYSEIAAIDPSSVDTNGLPVQFKSLTQQLWQARLSLRKNFAELYKSSDKADPRLEKCADSVRDIFRLHRYIEDYLGELELKPKRYVDKVDPKNLNPLAGEAPNLLLADGETEWTVRSGDVYVSRGNAFTSAAISRVGKADAQFSHVAFIYVNGPEHGKTFSVSEALANPNVLVLEAHIEVGSTIRTFAEYIADGNARTTLFRYPDSKIAHEAAKASYEYVSKYIAASYAENPQFPPKDPNHHVPYDFAMDESNAKQLFCSEIAYYGFKAVGVKIPIIETKLARNNDMIERLGIKGTQMFAPADMELDYRFEFKAEYRDYRKVANLRMKDAILTSVYDWMENRDYKIKPNIIQTTRAAYAWVMRHLDFNFVKEQLPKNMSVRMLNSVFVLDKVGEILQKHLEDQEVAYYSKTGRLMTLPQMKASLEKLREEDEDSYRTSNYSVFHSYLRPDSLIANSQSNY